MSSKELTWKFREFLDGQTNLVASGIIAAVIFLIVLFLFVCTILLWMVWIPLGVGLIFFIALWMMVYLVVYAEI